MFKVAIAKGSEYKSTFKALTLIKDDIKSQIAQKRPKTILLKPNLVRFDPPNWLPITKLDTIRATVDFISRLGRFRFIVADSSPTIFGWNTKEVLDNANYWQLQKEYKNLKVLDLNKERFINKFSILTQSGLKKIKVSKPILEADYLISLAKLKTHDTFFNTLSIKNIIMGAIKGDQKIYMHGTPSFIKKKTGVFKTLRQIKYFLLSRALLKPLADFTNRRYLALQVPYLHANHLIAAKYLYPNLVIIDGVQAMEGQGPGMGTPVPLGITIASIDALSADLTATRIMGIKVGDIPYLDILKTTRSPKFKTIGVNPKALRQKFSLHPNSSVFKIPKKKVLKLYLNSGGRILPVM